MLHYEKVNDDDFISNPSSRSIFFHLVVDIWFHLVSQLQKISLKGLSIIKAVIHGFSIE